MEAECCPDVKEDVVSKDPVSIGGPEGENIVVPTPDSPAPELPEPCSTAESGTSNEHEEQKQSKMQTLKRLVVGKTKSKPGEDQKDSSKTEDKSHPSRALRKSLSRVFSVSSSSIGRVWSSFSATRIHSEGESGTSTKTFGKKVFVKKNKNENENELRNDSSESRTHTLGRRLSASFRSAFGRYKET
ncbi:uncharacterized protein [Halyomorpha halys]|uniref:uncharacterized protein n=1 Tax=Halyomorpha halys TaxID=286706 RepID=UPI0006D51FE8|nr:uncharacterized protein LOC106686582 [Halyomorpha halys]XP_024218120.1 uncharacterized protein LOC106686582 [Halyomorpha halys]